MFRQKTFWTPGEKKCLKTTRTKKRRKTLLIFGWNKILNRVEDFAESQKNVINLFFLFSIHFFTSEVKKSKEKCTTNEKSQKNVYQFDLFECFYEVWIVQYLYQSTMKVKTTTFFHLKFCFSKQSTWLKPIFKILYNHSRLHFCFRKIIYSQTRL